MGLFNKKENQQNYINLVRKTAEEAMPQLIGWDMTLTTLEKGALEALKKNAAYTAKYVAMNMAASLVGLRVRTSENPHAKPVCITCFRGSEIHFLHIGDGMNKSNMSVDPEGCVCLTSSDIDSVKTGLGKKVTLTLKDGGKLIFAYGVGAGTIYSLPDGDKQLEQFLKSFT